MNINSTKKRPPVWMPILISVIVITALHVIGIYFYELYKKRRSNVQPSPGNVVKPRRTPGVTVASPGAVPDSYVPSDGTPQVNAAYRLIRAARYERAEALLRRLLEKDSKDAGALIALGVIYEKRGRLVKAQKAFRNARQADVENTRALEKLAVNAMLLDDPDSALEHYKKMEKIKPPGHILQLLKAEIHLLRGAKRKQGKDPRWKADAENARKVINIVSKEHDDWEIDVSRGNLNVLTGDRKQAVNAYEKAIQKGIGNAETRIDVLMALALLNQEMGNEKKSSQWIKRLVKFMDKWRPEEYGRSLYLREYALLFNEIVLGNDVDPDAVNKHRRYYRKLYRERMQLPEVEVDQTLYILSEMIDMEWEEGMATPLEEVNEFMSLAHGPKYPECFYNKMINRRMRYILGYVRFGDVYARFGKKGKALKYYKKALELSPKNPAVLRKIKAAGDSSGSGN